MYVYTMVLYYEYRTTRIKSEGDTCAHAYIYNLIVLAWIFG